MFLYSDRSSSGAGGGGGGKGCGVRGGRMGPGGIVNQLMQSPTTPSKNSGSVLDLPEGGPDSWCNKHNHKK